MRMNFILYKYEYLINNKKVNINILFDFLDEQKL